MDEVLGECLFLGRIALDGAVVGGIGSPRRTVLVVFFLSCRYQEAESWLILPEHVVFGTRHGAAHDADAFEVGVRRVGSGVDSPVADAGHRRGDIDKRQLLGIAETALSDTFQSFGQPYIAQSFTVAEGFVADALYAVGDIDGLQRVATIESSIADAGDGGWQLDVAKVITFLEHAVGYGAHACLRQRHLCQPFVIGEKIGADSGECRHVFGEGDGENGVTAVEGIIAYALHRGGDRQRLQPVAVVEGTRSDRLQSLVESQRRYVGIPESSVFYRLHRSRQGDSWQ